MKYNEYVKYRNDFFRPLTIEPDGKISSDTFLRFNLIQGDILKETIIESSGPAAIYSALSSILISKFPNKSEIVANNEINLTKYIEFPENNYCIYTDKDDKNNSYICMIIGEDSYKLKLDETMNTDESKIQNPFENILQVMVKNNMIVVWVKHDDTTIMCHLLYNAWASSCDKNELNNIKSIDEKIQNFRMLLYANVECKTHILTYSSLNNESEDEYDESYGKELSYRRALLEKIRTDRRLYITTIKAYTGTYKSITKGVRRCKRIINKLNMRESQMVEKINTMKNFNKKDAMKKYYGEN